MKLHPIREVELDHVYFSPNSHYPACVILRSRYAHNCSISMVSFKMLTNTGDSKEGQVYTIDEDTFISTYLEGDRDYREVDFLAIRTFYRNHYPAISDKTLSLEQLALECGVSCQEFESLFCGKTPIPLALAEKFAELTATPLSSWTSYTPEANR